jgi:hypothetical protein
MAVFATINAEGATMKKFLISRWVAVLIERPEAVARR